MSVKEDVKNKIDISLEISKKYDLKSTEKLLNESIEYINDFRVKLPLMGGFNAGKSSLLNSYLEKEYLPIAITPETAIATELWYSQIEKIEAIKKDDGSIDDYSIEDIKSINVSNYNYIKVFLNNDKLLQNKNIVLVDMPGLDSSIEAHNKSIVNYIEESSYFIIIADIEHNIKGSIIDFITEINSYNLNYVVLISKSESKISSDVEKSIAYNKNMLNDKYGKDVFVGSISAHENNLSDFESILLNLDIESITYNKIAIKTIGIISSLIKELSVKIKFTSLDTEEINKNMRQLDKDIITLNSKLKNEETRITNLFRGEILESIISDVSNSLSGQVESLVQALKSGPEAFKSGVVNTIRPTLNLAFKKHVEDILKQSFENMNVSLNSVTENLYLDVSSKKIIDDDMISSIQTLGKGILEKSKSGSLFNILSKDGSNVAWKSIASILAISTTVVAPIIEIAILFLPEVLKILGGLFGKDNVDTQYRDQVYKSIEEITNNLRSEVESNLIDIKNRYVVEVTTTIENEKSLLLESLESCKSDKKTKEEESLNIKNELEKDKQTIENIYTQLNERLS